jgi:hypothetical protein
MGSKIGHLIQRVVRRHKVEIISEGDTFALVLIDGVVIGCHFDETRMKILHQIIVRFYCARFKCIFQFGKSSKPISFVVIKFRKKK